MNFNSLFGDNLNSILTKIFNISFVALGISSTALAYDTKIVLNIQYLDLFTEVLKTIIATSLQIGSFFLLYIINHKTINSWFKDIKWFKKKNNEKTP